MLNSFHTRREFLTTGLKGIGLLASCGYVPAFLARTAIGAPADKDSPLLVVIQLSGGNDGLNTVIPLGNDAYLRARPTIGIGAANALPLNTNFGLNPALVEMKRLFDDGRMAVVHGVGYPNPDRSHFRSMDFWHTGSAPGERTVVSGWLGRYFDAQCSGRDPSSPEAEDQSAIGLNFGKVMPRAFRNRSNVGIALDDPNTFQWNPSGETSGLAKAQEEIFKKSNRPDAMREKSMFKSPAAGIAGGIGGTDPETLEFLRHTAMNAMVSGDRIRALLGSGNRGAGYPNSSLARELAQISMLIRGDFPTRVFYASQGGYDTHSEQAPTHARLLADLGEAVAAFLNELKAAKCSQRVMVLAFSEFGRRVAENGSNGTDHGAAAPVFLFGDNVHSGLHGTHPDLTDLESGDLKHTVDFRTVYASVLESWLQAPAQQILGKDFGALPIVRSV